MEAPSSETAPVHTDGPYGYKDAICNSYAGVTPIQEVTPREPTNLHLYSDDFNSRWAARCAYQILYTLHDHPVRGELFFQRMIERHKMRCGRKFSDALPTGTKLGIWTNGSARRRAPTLSSLPVSAPSGTRFGGAFCACFWRSRWSQPDGPAWS